MVGDVPYVTIGLYTQFMAAMKWVASKTTSLALKIHCSI
jgi:hypothetical protein